MLINFNLRDKEKFENIKTENFKICITFTIKYLRIHIDEELNFRNHITSIVPKISRGVGILYKIKKFFQPLLIYVYITVLCISK